MHRSLAITISFLSVLILLMYKYREWKEKQHELLSSNAINRNPPPLAAFLGNDAADDQVHFSSWWISNYIFLIYFLVPSSIILGLLNILLFVISKTTQPAVIILHWLLTLTIFRLNSWIFTRGLGWVYPNLYVSSTF